MKLLLISGFSFLTLNVFADSFIPPIANGEVKITYPCESLSLIPRQKEEKEIISFYELNNNIVYDNGYILRKRTSPEGSDFTIKYRIKDNIELDSDIYGKLSSSSNGELKCEYDMTYSPDKFESARSCSFKTESDNLQNEHFDFMKMIRKDIPGWNRSLKEMKEIKVEATSWKLSMTPEQAKQNPFTKKPSVEIWVVRGECKLEVSGKFTSPSADAPTITKLSEKGFKFLKEAIKAQPSEVQGNKTAWVLGLSPSK